MAESPNKNTVVEEEDPIDGPDAPGPSITGLFTSLMMLLMTFFIVLYSMATTSTSKLHEAKESVEETFGSFGLSTSKQAMMFLYSYIKLKLATPNAQENQNPGDSLSDDGEMLKTDTKSPEEAKDKTKAFWEESKLDQSSKVGKLILLGLNVERKGDGLVIKVPVQELFYDNSAELTQKGKLLIEKTFRTISNEFESLVIRAYAKEQKDTGTSALLISSNMASQVADCVNRAIELRPEQMSYFGNGNYRPLTFAPKNPREIELNYRIEFWIRGLWRDDDDQGQSDGAPGDTESTNPS